MAATNLNWAWVNQEMACNNKNSCVVKNMLNKIIFLDKVSVCIWVFDQTFRPACPIHLTIPRTRNHLCLIWAHKHFMQVLFSPLYRGWKFPYLSQSSHYRCSSIGTSQVYKVLAQRNVTALFSGIVMRYSLWTTRSFVQLVQCTRVHDAQMSHHVTDTVSIRLHAHCVWTWAGI